MCGVTKEFNKIHDKDRFYDFLIWLNDDFEAVNTQILSNNPLLILGSSYRFFNQDENKTFINWPIETHKSLGCDIMNNSDTHMHL